MSLMKRYLEEISERMGFEGEINEQVLGEAAERFEKEHPGADIVDGGTFDKEDVEVYHCVGCDRDFMASPTPDGKEPPDLCPDCAIKACEMGDTDYLGYLAFDHPRLLAE